MFSFKSKKQSNSLTGSAPANKQYRLSKRNLDLMSARNRA